ncbi:thermostable hemolysin [uncultured Microbulbifer sp.]|uniref:thermostable hemolysin n=1 Tax=uncultured Microbulbifer sp. TaxID=348147 RepID=UPI0025F27A61|nr:thermostable hemolysin [uncultured Microbulbifer sp.]
MAVDVPAQMTPSPLLLNGVPGGLVVKGEQVVGTSRARSIAGNSPLGFRLCGIDGDQRIPVESYITAQFRDVYGARIRHFLPWLLTCGKGDELHGVLGLRRAEQEPLFLEQYLGLPVEEVLSAAADEPVARDGIVEIGNLVATARGSSRLLFLMLAELFAAADLTWAIFTATPEVQHLLQKLTDNQRVLCRADGACLGTALADWGSYYACRPAVVAINVDAERRKLLDRPLVGELLAACRPQAAVFARLMQEQ